MKIVQTIFILELYSNLRDIQKVFKLCELMKKEQLKPSYKTLNNFLEMAMRMEDTNRIVENLQDFKKRSYFLFLDHVFIKI